MKKGLLSILAGALVLVGCQNYDDQFDALESQINALSSTVAGLSQVQSDLASLSGTVASLSSTVNGLGATIDASVASGISGLATAAEVAALKTELAELTTLSTALAALQATVDELTASLADVASSAEVDAIKTALATAQEDLDELLSSSNFYSNSLSITDNETLAFAKTLGKKLAIVNGNVSITPTAEMATADIQAVLDNIGTVVGKFTYSATSQTIAAVDFSKIKGTQDLDVNQAGNYNFASLTSAKNIVLGTTNATKVKVVNLESLKTVSTIVTGSVSHTIDFSEATNIHLTALPYYSAGSTLTLKAKEGSTIKIDNLASVNSDGEETTLNLIVEGASSLDFSKITLGNITATKVASVTSGADHDGTLTFTDVTKAVIPSYTGGLSFSSSTSDLEELHVIGMAPKRTTAVTTVPSLDLTGQTGLKKLIVEGSLNTVTVSGNTNLTDVTFTASVNDLTISGATDLTSLSLAGKAREIDVNGNTDLTSLTITTALNTAKINTSAAVKGGKLEVMNNVNLASLKSSMDAINYLDVSGNTKLAKLDFTGTKVIGGTTADVNIQSNKLNASKIVDKFDVPAVTGIGTGSISDESGLSTLATYLKAAVAAPHATNGVYVSLDSIDLYQTDVESGAPGEETNITSGSKLVIVDVRPVIYNTDSVTAVKGNKAYSYQPGDVVSIQHVNGGVTTKIMELVTLNANAELAAAQVTTAANGYMANADAVDVTLSAKVGGGSKQTLTILADNSSTTNESTNANSGAASSTSIVGTDRLVLTVGGLTVTATGVTATSTTVIATTLANLWANTYGSSATDTAIQATVVTSTSVITFTADESAGSRFDNTPISLTVMTGATATTTDPVVGYRIGQLKANTDNKTVSSNIIITLTSEGETAELDAIQSGSVSATTAGNGTVTATAPLVLVGGTSTTTDVQRSKALTDAYSAVEGSSATVSAAAKTTNYIAWLGK